MCPAGKSFAFSYYRQKLVLIYAKKVTRICGKMLTYSFEVFHGVALHLVEILVA